MLQLNSFQHRRGLTLVELVAVISIISLLASLLMMGIAASRANSRRLYCQNNMRQIGIATQSLLTAQSALPNPPEGGSFLVQLLPFLEQRKLYDQIQAEPDRILKQTSFEPPAIFICPSDGELGNHPGRAKAANYVGNAGRGAVRYGLDGLFGDPYRRVRVAEVTDGTSNTALVSECLAAGNTDNRRKLFDTIVETLDFSDLQRQIRLQATLNVSVPSSTIAGRGRPWVDGNLHHTSYHHAMLPNESSGINGNSISQGLYSASSEHSRGVNLLRLDGSIEFVSEEITENVWWALGSRNGKEVLSGEN